MGLRHGQAHALNMIAKTHMAKKEYENCLRAAERAARLFKDRGDKGMEAQALLTAASAGVMVCQEGGRGPISSRVYNEQMDKVGRQVKMAVEITESLGDDQLAAYALRASSQVNMIAGKGSEAMVAAEEAARISRSAKDEAAEAAALMLLSEVTLAGDRHDRAQEAAQYALQLFRNVRDSAGEASAIAMLEKIEEESKDVTVVRGKKPVEEEKVEEEASAAAAGGELATADKEKFLATLSMPERVSFQVKELIQGIVGPKEIEQDATVMETGLTSISSIMLRDQIGNEFPDVEGMELTFVFEYPTIRAMTDFIMEQLGDE